MEKEIKKLEIVQETEGDTVSTSLKTGDFSEFEAIGLLSYYLDALKVKMLQNFQQ